MCGQPRPSQVSRGILVKVPPQGNLGGGKARVVRKGVGGELLPLSYIGVGRHYLMVRRDGQVARKIVFCVSSVKTRRAGAVDGKLRADAIESWG